MDSFGRKIIFLFPSEKWTDDDFLQLVDHEYEVYRVDDPGDLDAVLTSHSDSVFIWGNPSSPEISDRFLDFCRSARPPSSPEISDRFLEFCRSSRPPSAIIDFHGDLSADCSRTVGLTPGRDSSPLSELLHFLESIGARGQRRFVRYGGQDESIATIAFYHEEDAMVGDVHDISSAGLSCSLEDGDLPVRTKLKELTLFLGDREYLFSGEVFLKRRSSSGDLVHVIMFDRGGRDRWGPALHRFILDSLQSRFQEGLRRIRGLE